MRRDPRNTGRRFIEAAAGLALTLAFVPSASAQQWEFTPSVFVGGTYTDNTGLTTNALAESETSYEVSPRFGLNRVGPRWTLNSNYQLQSRFYEDNSRDDDAYHNLELTSLLWLVNEVAGVNFNSHISQQIIDPAEKVSLTTATRSGNRSETGTYSIEPFVQQSIGSNAVGRLSYRYGLVEYDAPQLQDSKYGRFIGSIGTDPTQATWSASAFITRSDIEYDTGREITLNRASIDVGYRVAPRSEFVVTLGADDNDLGDLPFAGDIDGAFWLVGLRGSLDESTTYEVRAGEQFYGSTYLVQFDRQKGRLGLGLTYDEETTTRGASQLDYENILGFLSEAGFDVGGIEEPAISQDVFVTERFSINGTYTMPKSTWTFNIFHRNRDYITSLDGGVSDSSVGAALRWSWNPTTRTRVGFGVNWQEFELRNDQEEPQDLRFEASWRRTIFDRSFVSVRLLHNRRSATRDPDEYEENVITLGVGYEL